METLTIEQVLAEIQRLKRELTALRRAGAGEGVDDGEPKRVDGSSV
jgi:ribosomal protein L29